MRQKSARVVARNMRWISLLLGACLILSLVLCGKLFLSSRSAAKEQAAKVSDLNSGMREMIVLRLDHQSDIYAACADYLAANETTAMANYLAGAKDLSGTADFTNAAWNRLFPDNKDLSGLCDQLTHATASLTADKLSSLSEDERASLADLFDQLSATLDRDSTFTTLTALIGLAEPDAAAITEEIKAVNGLLDQMSTLLAQAGSSSTGE